MKIKTAAAALALVWVLGGCVFFQNTYVEPAEFDLLSDSTAKKEVKSPALPVSFGVFRNLSGSDRRFLIRRLDGTMHRDEYRRWLVEPEMLLERRLQEALGGIAPGSADVERVRISGSIYRFEFEPDPSRVHFEARFTLAYGERRVDVPIDTVCDITAKISAPAAMAECVDRAAAELRSAIMRLNEVKK